jgi:hypothetical protein
MLFRPSVQACEAPANSLIRAHLPGADFHDAFRTAVAHPERTAMQHFLAALSGTPGWVRQAMTLRNRVVVHFGLRQPPPWQPTPGRAPDSYRPGERLGVFELLHIDDDEVLAGDDDKHLRVLLSVRRVPAQDGQPARVVLSTVVHIHNLLGRLYMLPVGPAHKLIAPAVLARVNQD